MDQTRFLTKIIGSTMVFAIKLELSIGRMRLGRIFKVVIFALLVLVLGCVPPPNPTKVSRTPIGLPREEIANPKNRPLEELPMYGGEPFNDQLKVELEYLRVEVERKARQRLMSNADYANLLVIEGDRLFSQNQNGQAMNYYNQAWLISPNNNNVYIGMSKVVRSRDGDFVLAKRLVSGSVEKTEEAAVGPEVIDVEREAFEKPKFGSDLKTPKIQEQIAEFLDQSEQVSKDENLPKSGIANRLLDQGQAALLGGDYGQAMQRFNQVWILEPKNHRAIAGMAQVLLERDRNIVGANLLWQEVTPHLGDDIETRRAFANYLMASNQPDKCLEEADKILARTPKDALTHWTKAGCLVELNRIEEALVDFAQADHPDTPNLASLKGDYAAALSRAGQFDIAEVKAREGVEMRPDDVLLNFWLIRAQFSQGLLGKACPTAVRIDVSQMPARLQAIAERTQAYQNLCTAWQSCGKPDNLNTCDAAQQVLAEFQKKQQTNNPE